LQHIDDFRRYLAGPGGTALLLPLPGGVSGGDDVGGGFVGVLRG